MQKIIIIGGGIAGLTAAENARGKDPDAEILIISEEDYVPYSRMKLSKYIYAPINEKNLYIHNKKWYEDKNIELLLSFAYYHSLWNFCIFVNLFKLSIADILINIKHIW